MEMMIPGRALLALLSLLLTSCALGTNPANDPRISQAPMNNASRGQAIDYFSQPNPKAFAFNPETGMNWHAWGQSSVEEAQYVAVSECENRTGGECILFAVNDEIVWEPTASVRQPEPSTRPAMIPVRTAGADTGGSDLLIEGLFKEVPPPGTPWSTADQIRWLEAAQYIFALVYNRRERINIQISPESELRS
jgi:hypothetical protein